MPRPLLPYNDPILPTADLMAFAKQALEEQIRFQIIDTHHGAALPIPQELHGVIQTMLAALAANQAFVLSITSTELTTNQAADLLNVSRMFVIREIEAGRLSCRKVGTHRRVPLEAALAYKQHMFDRASKALDDIAAIDEALGLDD